MVNDFYIGWQPRPSPSVARFLRAVALTLLAISACLSGALAIAQRTIGNSVFEWGQTKQFSGRFVAHPYPHLISQTNTYYLVAPFKHGLDTKLAARLDGQNVLLQGALIYRDNQQMIEVIESSTVPAPSMQSIESMPSIPLGRQTLAGEIVDSKCYFGVMNPGQFIPHRACAIRCISGGIPPVLVVHDKSGQTTCLLLTASDGRPINKQILRLIAEPVQITGLVEQTDSLLTLRVESIKRL